MKRQYLFPIGLILISSLAVLWYVLKKPRTLEFDPPENAHIVFIGNGFAERLQRYNYFEPLLYKSFPDKNLVVRTLAWSGDEINEQERPLNFGSLDEHLTEQKTDIIFASYGMNESFKGADSVASFKEQFRNFLHHLQQQQYNGHTTPQIIVLSPIAHENLGNHLGDAVSHNKNLVLYLDAMASVAKSLNIGFIDLYHSTEKLFERVSEPLTINGIHLNEEGYRLVSKDLAGMLGLKTSFSSADNTLKYVIDQKNKHFFYKYRAVNGEYIYGRRKEPWVQPKGGVVSYPSEMKTLDSMVAALDSTAWQVTLDPSGPGLAKANRIISHAQQRYPPSTVVKEEVSTDQFVVQDGFKVELFASEQDFPLANPVKLTFDPQGRLWVATMPSYPQYFPGSPPNDKILILEDTDHDGKADTCTVFADSLYMPLGFELGNGGVYVTQAPDLLFLKDTDGDGKADYKEIVMQGFGTEDVHHSINAYTWGQDGALYMHMGTFLHSQIETPYGVVRGAYGETYRYEPRTMKLEAYVSYPYANPWGNVFMRDGTHLIGDVSTGMNYFAPPLTVAIDYPKKHIPMKDFLTIPVRPKTCGMEIISSRQFPESSQNNVLFNTFIGFQGIKQHVVSEQGSGIIAHETVPLLQSKDLNFRPVDLQFGPDGSLYVADWFNPIINHGERALRDPGRDHSHGRIWRITYRGNKSLEVVDLTRLSLPDLLDHLKSYEDRVRYRVRTQLSNMPAEKVMSALGNWLQSLDRNDKDYEKHALEGLWVHQQFHKPNGKLLNELLAAKDYHIRAAATRALFYWRDSMPNAFDRIVQMSKDSSQRVRLEAIVALSHFRTPESVRALLAATDLPVDYYIDYALKESFKHLQPVWTAMFKQDRYFLASEPAKAKYLLEPLSSGEYLKLPSFLSGDPDIYKYYRDSLSASDYGNLREAVAVNNFRNNMIANAASERSDDNSKAKIIHIATVPGKMAFDKTEFTVPSSTNVSIVFKNADEMPHNIVIIKPGSAEKVGKAADAMASQKDGFEKNFIPVMPEVLFATPLVSSDGSYQLKFISPSVPGQYPFICSFPGHWRIMTGVMIVSK